MTLISSELRSRVVQRAGNCCEYCRLSQESQVATFPVDHIIPSTAGGPTELSNLALACPRCNARKWSFETAQDPDTGQIVSLFHPRRDRWSEHFRWSQVNPAIIEPLTSIARATVALLDLNSSRQETIRRWLMVLGRHPSEAAATS